MPKPKLPSTPTKRRRPRRRPNPLKIAMREIENTAYDLIDEFVSKIFDNLRPGPGPGSQTNTPPPPPSSPRSARHPSGYPPSTTLYDVLELSPVASPETISAAYKSLSKRFHPDLPTGNVDRMKIINQAHDVLSDPVKRRKYDQTLRGSI